MKVLCEREKLREGAVHENGDLLPTRRRRLRFVKNDMLIARAIDERHLKVAAP